MADEMEPQEERPGMSRRTLIKRAAIIGGVAWATPVILSTPAFAQPAAGSVVTHACCACTACVDPDHGAANSDHNTEPELASQAACTSCISCGCVQRYSADDRCG